MIIPIGHEQGTVRRQPWVTYGLMGLCVVVFVFTHFGTQARVNEGVKLLRQAVDYYVEHPYLELNPRLERLLGGDPTQGRKGSARPLDSDFATLEQTELDGLTEAGFLALDDTPLRRWGFVPAQFSVVTLFTYMFLHAGWLHLFGNLLFLYLSGPFLEDVWGRPFFAGFYLVSGVFAGLFYGLRFPHLAIPLVGASGAIAGILGAFLVRHWKRKIRFFYWVAMFFRGTFSAPAWVVLPLWFVNELFSAWVMDSLAPGAGGGGVAYWAHVSGFAFGALATWGMLFFRVEEQYLQPALDRHLTEAENPALARAMDERRLGRTEDAWTVLFGAARRNPENPDNVVALWDLALQAGRTEKAAPVLVRHIQMEVRRGAFAEANLHWQELRRHAPETRIPLGVEVRLAQGLEQQGTGTEAREVLAVVLDRVGPDTPPGLLSRLIRLTEGRQRAKVVALALAHPELPPEKRVVLEKLLKASGKPGAALDGAPHEPKGWNEPVRSSPVSAPSAGRTALRLMRAVPLSVAEGTVAVDLEAGGRRAVPLERIRAIAAASVDEGGVEPNLVMDLVLKSTSGANGALRVVRFESRSFDPCRLVPTEEETEDAFLSLYGMILAGSGASAVLDLGSRGQLPAYDSPEAYRRQFVAALKMGVG